MPGPQPQPDPRRTVLRAIVILIGLVIAVFGMGYTGWMIYKLPASK